MSAEYLNNRIFEEIILKFQQSRLEKIKYEFCIEDLQEAKNRGNKNPRINNRLNKLIELKSQAINNFTESQEKLAFAFLTLSENIVKYAKFNLIDMDDAIQEGVVICFEKIDRFDPKKGKAFNYMTTCILNHLRQIFRTNRNYNEFKKKYQDFLENQVEKSLAKYKKSNKNYNNMTT